MEDARVYLEQANDQVLVALMLEEPATVEQLEAIAAVPGVDIFNMGPWDLSTAYGYPIKTRHPLVLQAFDKALKVGRQHGIHPENEQDIKHLFNKGACFFELVALGGVPDRASGRLSPELSALVSSGADSTAGIPPTW